MHGRAPIVAGGRLCRPTCPFVRRRGGAIGLSGFSGRPAIVICRRSGDWFLPERRAVRCVGFSSGAPVEISETVAGTREEDFFSSKIFEGEGVDGYESVKNQNKIRVWALNHLCRRYLCLKGCV